MKDMKFTPGLLMQGLIDCERERQAKLELELKRAAAPEMYEALNACHMQLLQSNNRTEYAHEACEMALNALRKAEGRQ